MGNVILVIAQKNFQDKEFMDTKEALQSKGFKCDIASKTIDICEGQNGLKVNPDITIEDALIGLEMYKAVVFIGGGGASEYFDDDKAKGLAKMSLDKGLIVGAICIAPIILAKAGLLKGRNATVWDGNQEQSRYFSDNEINFIPESVVVDDNIVTANGPSAATAFGEKIASLLE
jgi:protease I